MKIICFLINYFKVSQIPKILGSDLFITFFLNAQKETQIEEDKSTEIIIFLMNFEKITIEIESFDVTEDVLIVKLLTFIFK